MVSPCTRFFFFNDTATTEIYTLSLHDALPILRESSPPPDISGREPDEIHDVQPLPPRAGRYGEPPGPARSARRLPPPVRLRRRRVLPSVLGRVRRGRIRSLARRPAAGDPPGAHGFGPADARNAQGVARRIDRRRGAGRRPRASAGGAARQDRSEADR